MMMTTPLTANASVGIGAVNQPQHPSSSSTAMSTLQLSPSGDSNNSQVSNGHNYDLRKTSKRLDEERVTFSLLSQSLSSDDPLIKLN